MKHRAQGQTYHCLYSPFRLANSVRAQLSLVRSASNFYRHLETRNQLRHFTQESILQPKLMMYPFNTTVASPIAAHRILHRDTCFTTLAVNHGSAQFVGKIRVISSGLGGWEGFDAGELQPPHTTPIGQDLRNGLWK
jgi:hypothetical protein